MSSDWRETTVGDVATLVTKGTTPTTLGFSFIEKGVNFLKVEAMTEDGRFIPEKFMFVSLDTHAALSRSQLSPDDVLFSIAGTIGRTAIVTSDILPANTNQAIAMVRPNKMLVQSRYLRYLLSSPKFTTGAVSRTVQSVQANFSLGELKATRILLPPLCEQERISALLGSLDDRITLLRETNATLEAIAQALFKSWFVDFDPVRAKMEGRAPEGMDEATAALFPDSFEESELGLVPKGWKVHRLGDVVDRITKGTTPTTLKRPFVASGINFIKAESITDDGGFIPHKFAFIDSETHGLLRRSQLEAGDVLISIAGTIGRIAVMSEDFVPANTNQAVALIRPVQDRFPSGLVSRFLQRSESQQLMGERVVQAVQANLSLGSLSDLKVILPPPEVLRLLYQTGMAEIDSSKLLNRRRVRTLTDLRDTLLPRLISGQLRLPEAEALAA